MFLSCEVQVFCSKVSSECDTAMCDVEACEMPAGWMTEEVLFRTALSAPV